MGCRHRPVAVVARVLACAAAGAAVAGLAGTSTAPAAALRQRNPQIAGLQVALRAYGLYSGKIDALSGPLTVAGVRAFQQRAGLPASGRADARTRVALGPVGGPLLGRRALKLKMFGWDVAVLQFLLEERGLSKGPITGWFDRPTLLGVRRFQRSVHLEPDGVVGRATEEALAKRWLVPLAPRPKPLPRSVPAPRIPLRYTVQPGDTLSAIAARAATTPQAVARLNRMPVDAVLAIGRRLLLPPPAAPQEAPPTPIRSLIDRVSDERGVDRHLTRALAWVESGYQPQVVSPVGALGVMQVMPSTWEWVEAALLRRRVRRTAAGNVLVGVTYLRHLLDEFQGDRRLAVAAWLQGPFSVQRDGVQPETMPFVNAVLDLSKRV